MPIEVVGHELDMIKQYREENKSIFSFPSQVLDQVVLWRRPNGIKINTDATVFDKARNRMLVASFVVRDTASELIFAGGKQF